MDAPQNFRNAINGFNKEDVVHYLEYLNAKYAAQINQLDTELSESRQKVQKLQEELDCKASLVDQSRDMETAKADLERTKAALQEAEARSTELNRRCEELQDQLDHREASQAPSQDLQDRLDRAAEENRSLSARCSQLQKELAQRDLTHSQEGTQEMNRLNALVDSTAAENASLNALVEKLTSENTTLKLQCEDLRRQAAKAVPVVQAPVMADKELEAYRRAERAERVATERAEHVYQRTNLVLSSASGKIDATAADLSGAADRVLELLTQLQTSIASSKAAVNEAVGTLYALRTDGKSSN